MCCSIPFNFLKIWQSPFVGQESLYYRGKLCISLIETNLSVVQKHSVEKIFLENSLEYMVLPHSPVKCYWKMIFLKRLLTVIIQESQYTLSSSVKLIINFFIFLIIAVMLLEGHIAFNFLLFESALSSGLTSLQCIAMLPVKLREFCFCSI